MSLPAEARAATLRWDAEILRNYSASFHFIGAAASVWRFTNLTNGYRIDLLSVERNLAARLGMSMPRGTAGIAPRPAARAQSVSLSRHMTVKSAFAAYELIGASIERFTFGVSAGASVEGGNLWVRSMLGRRLILEIKTGTFTANESLEVNIGALGDGIFYGPV